MNLIVWWWLVSGLLVMVTCNKDWVGMHLLVVDGQETQAMDIKDTVFPAEMNSNRVLNN